MAKGDVKIISVIGSTGGVVRDFETKEVIAGSYRHSQTVGGTTYSWKCGMLQLTGVVKLVEDEYDGNVFYRMEGIAKSAAEIKAVADAKAEIAEMEW